MPRGRLRIYIAAASGAGTTYAMLDEALRRRSRGTDVMVGCVDTGGRPTTTAMLQELVGDAALPWPPEALSVGGIRARRPAVVLVDDLGAPNPPTSGNSARWQDVDELLENGIDVITTVTVQHIESLADTVRKIVGTVPPVLVPDSFLARADQIELIDISPEAIRRRIAHGNVFDRDAGPEDSELFNSEAFALLRILLLQWMIDRLSVTSPAALPQADVRERVVVGISGAPSGDAVVRRAARLAQRSRAALVGVHVHRPGEATPPLLLERTRSLVAELGGTFREIEGNEVPEALLAFAEIEGATQLVIGTPDRRARWSRHQSVLGRIARRTTSVDVHVVSREKASDEAAGRKPHNAPTVRSSPRRIAAGTGGAVLLAALTALFVSLRDDIDVSTALGIYLLVVVGIAALGGRLAGIVSAVAAPLIANWFLIEPYRTLRINDPENLTELLVFVTVALIVSTFVSVAAARAADAEQAREEATNLARLAGSGGPDALQVVVDHLCTTFSLDGVAVIEQIDGRSDLIVTSGSNPPTNPAEADFSEPISDSVVVAARGRALTVDEHRVMHVFFGQIAKLVEQHHVAELAAEAEAFARADELRTAILRAVSHDLRSPLAAIKASASSLRQSDVEWPEEIRNDFLASIEDETDRLTTIVSNLLDMGRLQAGAVRPAFRPVPLEEVLPAAVHSIGARGASVDLVIPGELPDALADPALLERVLANIIANAVEFSPHGERVRVSAVQYRRDLQIYVVDHGPGIRPADRATVLQPFHRLSDSQSSSGVGLGLAIADGLTTAMGGHLELRDTPNGGLTVMISLAMADLQPPSDPKAGTP